MQLIYIKLSSLGWAAGSADFYDRVFGLDHIFGTSEFRGPQVDKVQ